MSVGGKDLVLETLCRAASQDASTLKPAERQLQLWETEPGFYFTLVQIFSDRSVEVTVRWLAVLYFKNGVDRYWRKTAPNAISEEEKTNIRHGLLQNLGEPVPQVATQLAVLISKIARVDCPREWGELLPALFLAVRSSEELVQHRALLTLYYVVKQLASKRLAADRRTFQELTQQMYSWLCEVWRGKTEAFLGQGGCLAAATPALECSHLSLKILRKLTVHGFRKPEESQEAMLFLETTFERIRLMLTLKRQHETNDQVCSIIEKYIVLLTKVLRDMLEDYPFAYVRFIKPSLELVTYYVFTPAGEGLLFERFTVQCLNLMKSLLLCPEYKPCKVLEDDTKNTQTIQASTIKSEFFTESVLAGICHKLVSHYFLLTPEDLEMWENDPEGFCSEVEGGESWKYSLRPSTETLFVSLFHEYRASLVPVVVELVRSSQQPVNPGDSLAILQKDAVYNAAGLAAFELFDDIDFDQWFTSSLVNELRMNDSNYRVIRRRVIWLVGQWTGVKFSPEHHPTLYQAIIHLLNSEEDLVVRLGAASTLRLALDNFEFDPEQFMSFLPTVFGLLFSLLKEAKECDTKMQVLHVMSFMIEVVGAGIRPHAEPLTQYLPGLWDASTDHNLLRCAILTTLVHMVNGLMHESEALHDYLISIIRVSTDVREPCHVYLVEDGLHLWLTTLENTNAPHPALLALYDNMIPLIQTSSENLRLCLQITTAYTLLCPQQFLAKYGEQLVETLRSLLTDLKCEGVVLVLRAVEMIVRVVPGPGGDLVRPLLPPLVLKVAQADGYPMLMSMYMSLLARLVLYTQEIFMWALDQASSSEGKTPEDVLERVVTVWSDKLALVSPEERRKLCALGLARLCGTGWPPVMKVWPPAVSAIVEVVYDMTLEDSTQDKLVVSHCGNLGSPEPLEPETENMRRRQKLAESDPVHTTSLRDYLGAQMKQLRDTVPLDTINALAQDLDSTTVSLLHQVTPS